LTEDKRTLVIATSHARYFYFYMALACVGVAFLGFAPTYWMPMASGKLPPMPVVHFHGLLFFAWTLYFAFQSWLAASGQIARHRMIGLIGVSLATAMTIFGFLVAVYGGIALMAVKLLNWPISATPLWHSFAGGILALAQ
jgi:hypothetical protein